MIKAHKNEIKHNLRLLLLVQVEIDRIVGARRFRRNFLYPYLEIFLGACIASAETF